MSWSCGETCELLSWSHLPSLFLLSCFSDDKMTDQWCFSAVRSHKTLITVAFIVMYFHVLNLKLWIKKVIALCAGPHLEWVSFVCVSTGLHTTACLFSVITQWPLTVLYSGFTNCTCPVITKQTCVSCVRCSPFSCEDVRRVFEVCIAKIFMNKASMSKCIQL